MINRVRSYLHEKRFDTWIEGYARHVLARRNAPRAIGTRHLIFAFCDHHEPLWNAPSEAQADARVEFWVDNYPKLAREFTDADGHHPRHSFFFPGEQYKPAWLDALAGFTKQGIGEVEV